ncbi:MAG: head-tail connector protein [Hyphomicrobiales bacterium]|nr:head-tail connector protein [Hyphomicrobiales bacterium]MDE2113807.1 head-tail connector protein [Hyphomicrobiales bacterium]
MPIQLSPPVTEPLQLADVKAWLKIDFADDDAMIAALIPAARMVVETHTRRKLLTQTWRLVLDHWPQDNMVILPLAPFQSIAAITVFDASNQGQSLSASLYFLDNSPDAARMLFAIAPPAPQRQIAGINIDVVAGYGAGADSVPQPILQAMRMLIAHWYEDRGDGASVSGARLPAVVAALLDPFRIMRLT